MGLINDARFYLMIALAALFLIVVAMCSSTQHAGTDAHTTSGVNNNATSTAAGQADEGEANMEASNVDASNVDASNVDEGTDKDANAEQADAENKMELTALY